jgi:isopentenyl-diphosphate delta-isomerase
VGQVILVSKNDEETGLAETVSAHLGEGKLHRAFVVFLVNDEGEFLIQKRSAKKMLWPLFWDVSCASHPLRGEGYKEAGERRLKEELGIKSSLEIADKFQYQENYLDIGSENEICTTLIGRYNGKVLPNNDEVAETKWISLKNLRDDMKINSDQYTIWLKIALDRLIKKGEIKKWS